MQEPAWILKSVVLAIHTQQIFEHGGEAGIRDDALLENAFAKPQNMYAYREEERDIFDFAAAYGFCIIQNHPFVDGNR